MLFIEWNRTLKLKLGIFIKIIYETYQIGIVILIPDHCSKYNTVSFCFKLYNRNFTTKTKQKTKFYS